MSDFVRRHHITVFLFLLAGIMSVLNLLPSFVLYMHRPAGSVFIGNPHYWEDYLLYLNHFFQGAHGAWLVANRYTSEPTPPGIVYITNLLMGKLAGWIHLSPQSGYLIWLFILSVIAIYFMYRVIYLFLNSKTSALIGTVYAVTATSFLNHIWVNGKSVWWPFQIWRTPHFAFDRLGGAPHQLTQTISYLLLTYLLFTPVRRKIYFGCLMAIAFFAAILTITNPVQSAMFVGFIWATISVPLVFPKWHRSLKIPDSLRVLTVTGVTGLCFIVVNTELNQLPNLQSKIWESTQMTSTSLPFLLLSIGPIVIWVLIGIINRIKHLTAPLIFSLLNIGITYTVFFSPIPRLIGVFDLRFLFPSTYVFFGVFAAVAHHWAVARAALQKRRLVSILVLSIFLLLTIPTLVWELSQKLVPPDPTTRGIIYLPRDTALALSYLAAKPVDQIVLANPTTRMDSIVPAVSGHTSYSGHMLATIQNSQKQSQAAAVFTMQDTPEETQSFLTRQHIAYILFTGADGNWRTFQTTYPFLTIAYKNTGATVFIVRPSL